jgi:hypothetical protein
MVGELDTRVGKLADLNTNITNKTSIVGAINAVRTEALNAVNAGGSGSVITVRKDNNNKYTVLQGGNEVAESIEIADATFDVKVGGGLAGDDVQFSANATENKEITISHAAKATGLVDGTEADRTYIKKLTFDDYGHVTGYVTGKETVVDTNTAHSHANGKGTTVTANGGVEGEVAVDLNIGIKLEDDYIIIYDATSNTEIAKMDATDLVEDSYLDNVEVTSKEDDHEYLTFTFKLNNGDTRTVNIDLNGLVDTYTGVENDYIKVEVKDYEIEATLLKVDTDVISKKAVTEEKLSDEIVAKLNKEWQPVGDYKTIQETKSFEGSTVKTVTKVEQNANGEVEVTYEEIAFPEFPELPDASGQAVIASVANDVVTLKTGATLGDVNGTHTLANAEGEDIVLAKVAKTGSAYDLKEANAGKDKDGEDILYFVLDCNW